MLGVAVGWWAPIQDISCFSTAKWNYAASLGVLLLECIQSKLVSPVLGGFWSLNVSLRWSRVVYLSCHILSLYVLEQHINAKASFPMKMLRIKLKVRLLKSPWGGRNKLWPVLSFLFQVVPVKKDLDQKWPLVTETQTLCFAQQQNCISLSHAWRVKSPFA